MTSRWPSSGRGDSRAASAFVTPTPPGSTPLSQSVQYVRGVGPHRARLLAVLGITTVADLLEFFPFRHDYQPPPQGIDTLRLDETATVIAAVESTRDGGSFGREAVHANVRDGSGVMRVTWFNAAYLRDRLQRGQILRLCGRVGEHASHAQMVNPDVEWLDPDVDLAAQNSPRLIPVYRATAGLTSMQIARLVDTAIRESLNAVRETLPPVLLRSRDLPGRREAMLGLHHPRTQEEAETSRRRIAYEELLMMQLAISLRRRHLATWATARPLPLTPLIDERIRRRFPFKLTAAQDRVITEICGDLARNRPMTRLLQGDVGSGKTVVALYAALVAVANRTQCAILAPTEVLAAQHFAGIERYLAGSRVRRCLLTGKTPKARREPMLCEIQAGGMDLIVGTQALLETKVAFGSLGLVIVDEQHKFGVSQRAMLRDKNGQGRRERVPHYFVMTATPIPRTLSMTVFGDLEVSVIDQLPPGRRPITTHLVRPEQESRAWRTVRERIAAGEQAYIVCPLVEESDALDLKAATAEVQRVATELLPGSRVGLLHGRLRHADKQAVMSDFVRGALDALVSTTVIEVGVDVANATVMVIQHAERYGLSALHQLRGRVGRGSRDSLCFLFSDSRGELANQRLGILCKTTDGFRIAEEDLRIRGPGELLGTRQHGWPEFRVADPIADVELLMQARDDAAALVREDPQLARPAHGTLRDELRRRFRGKLAFIDVA